MRFQVVIPGATGLQLKWQPFYVLSLPPGREEDLREISWSQQGCIQRNSQLAVVLRGWCWELAGWET